MSSKANISIKNAYVEGVNTTARVKSLRAFLMGQGKLLSSYSVPILNNINLEIKQGEKVGFVGGNGCGKSSLLKLITGIYPLKSGAMKIQGNIAASIEMGFGMEHEMTGRQNIKLIMVYNNMLSKHTAELENEIIEFTELGDKIDYPIKNYSSGMLSRLAFTVTLFQEPDILLLDEIFATGDQHFVSKSTQAMKEKFLLAPISILVSHQESLVKEICNRCLLIKNGTIVEDGTPNEIFNIYNKSN